jgi:hypothetical protein
VVITESLKNILVLRTRNSPDVDVFVQEKDACTLSLSHRVSKCTIGKLVKIGAVDKIRRCFFPNSMTTDESSAEIKLIAELPGAPRGL